MELCKKVSDAERVLVICLAGAGDALLTTPFLRELRRLCPHATIDVLTMQAGADSVLSGNECIDNLHHFPFHKSRYMDALRYLWGLRRSRYAISFTIMPHNRLEYNVVTRLVGATVRIGFRYAIRCGALPRLFLTHHLPEDLSLHIVENNMRLLGELLNRDISTPLGNLELSITDSHRAYAARWISEHVVSGHTVIGIHAGSGTTKNLALKRWPQEQWVALLHELKARDCQVLLFGGKDEVSMNQAILSAAKLDQRHAVLVAPTTIQNSAALMKQVTCFICGDTLLTHVAAAVNVPTVVIHGPTPPQATYPWQTPHRIVCAPLPCRPCYGYSRFGIRCTNPQPIRCLHDVTPKMVMNSVDALLST